MLLYFDLTLEEFSQFQFLKNHTEKIYSTDQDKLTFKIVFTVEANLILLFRKLKQQFVPLKIKTSEKMSNYLVKMALLENWLVDTLKINQNVHKFEFIT